MKRPYSCTLRMADEQLAHGISKLQKLTSISLPTDYSHPSGSHKLVEAAHNANLSEQTCISLLKLTLYDETKGQNNNDPEDEDGGQIVSKRPSGFRLLLAAFTVLLHRYTSDTDLVIGSSSVYKQDPVVLRFPVDPQDPFWAVVRRVQHVERGRCRCRPLLNSRSRSLQFYLRGLKTTFPSPVFRRNRYP